MSEPIDVRPMVCPACQEPFEPDAHYTTGSACAACLARYTAQVGRQAPLVTRGPGGAWLVQEEVPLDDAFRGRFDVKGILGVGSRSTVYAAYDREHGRDVAIKLMGRTQDPSVAREFVEEARLLRQVTHVNVSRMIDAGMTSGYPYLVGEVASGNLGHLLERGALRPAEAVRLALDVLSGLSSCHVLGIVHRDIKPANILITRSGRARLADLGIARQYGDFDPLEVERGLIVGTPLYMSPEQLRGEPAGITSDLFAVGVVLYEMLTGHVPFPGPDLPSILKQQEAGPAPLEAPERVASTLSRALLVPQHRRWQIASQFAERLVSRDQLLFQDWEGSAYFPSALDDRITDAPANATIDQDERRRRIRAYRDNN